MRIQLEHVSKHFELPEGGGRRNVLKDISLTLRPGDSVSVVGPSGSGKSTLLNMIGGLDRPSGGTVLFNDQDLWKLPDRELAAFRNRHMGFVFQLHYLLPQLTLLENVLVPLIPQGDKGSMRKGRDRAMALLEQVGLHERVHQRPGQLSVGECQRAAVVRALVNEPEFILADEPTGSLDQENADSLGDLLSGLGREGQVAVVVVTHAMDLAKKMRTMIRIEDGHLTGTTSNKSE